ncbi:perlucin-like [Saccostrea echinata]|uniref:perlucin-like n=1 Tax=Saccostrea echinata TaxID=191078 RepID=UPI002A80B86D|nr:perlucin-like [Saccostrea echinata]
MILFFLIVVCNLSLETFAQNPCPDQWYWHGDSCYAFIRDIKANMMQAGAFCRNVDSTLAEINSADEDRFLRTHLIQNHISEHFWIGGTDAFAEGQWVWISNQKPLTYKGWAPGEPNNGVGGACLTLAYHEGYHWNDDHCRNEYDFICEKEIGHPDVQVIG